MAGKTLAQAPQIIGDNTMTNETMTGKTKYGFTLYHVYFQGLKKDNLDSNFLLTYNGKKAPGLDKLLASGHTGKLFMDSGAYPASKKNTDLDIDKYIEYVWQVHEHFEAIAQLDYIPRIADGTAQYRQHYSGEETWRRFLYMWDRVPKECRHKLIYIVHEAENIEPLLERALQWRDAEGNRIQYLGIGLATPHKAQRMHHLQTTEMLCKKYNFDGNLHAFGSQILELFQKSQYITTADSSSAIRDQMRGYVFVEGKQIKVSDDTSPHHKSNVTQKQNNHLQQKMKQRAERFGIDYEEAKINPSERYIWGVRERDDYFVNGSKVKLPLHVGRLI